MFSKNNNNKTDSKNSKFSNDSNNKKVNEKEKDNKWVMNNVRCWYKQCENRDDKQIFIKGRVIQEDKLQQKGVNQCVDIALEQENGQIADKIQANLKLLYQREENTSQTFDDMVKMNILNEAELINNLRLRYDEDKIFTYIGPTLIVLNPYKSIPQIFSIETIEQIKENLQKNFQTFSLEMQQPHIYSLSALAYKNLLKEKRKQTIVISGESGAGKTENARYSMKFLTSICSHDDTQESIEEKILSCNPILEAFGNAKTVRNDNSSRFGKYVQIQVINQRITGATISKYLLEKSRVIHLGQGERNYHIFYHLLESKNKDLLDKLFLNNKKAQDFNYLNQSDCFQVDGINDSLLFDGIIDSFNLMKFEDSLQLSIFKMLSAILYLGNLQFSQDDYQEGISPCKVSNEDVLQLICQLLEINCDDLRKALLYKSITVKNETCYKPFEIDLCYHAKNTLSKAIYDNLFNELVFKLNNMIKPHHHNSYIKDNTQINSTIGLLDIFGFENFKQNSFEQLCINYTNENLQQLYISYVFKNEELIFKNDGIEEHLSNLCYQDNAYIIDALNKSYKLLNDSCKTTKDDTKYLTKLKSEFSRQDVIALQFPKRDNGTFTINHTQNPVIYEVEGFNTKNIDELSQSIKDVILESKNKQIPSIFQSEETNYAHQGKFLGEKFNCQMKELMDELNSSDVHFVRCVKQYQFHKDSEDLFINNQTNELKRKEYFLEGYVLQQIQYLGVLNSIEVRKSTYPQRRDYQTFFREYKICDDILEKKPIEQIKNFQYECKYLAEKMFPQYDDKMVLFGNNKIFMKMEFESAIDQIKCEQIQIKKSSHATRIQLYYRYYKFHVNFQRRIQTIKKGANNLVNNFYNQKIFNIYDQAFQQIKTRARMAVLKQFLQLKMKIIKKFNSKQVLDILIKNKKDKNELTEQERIQKQEQKIQQKSKKEEELMVEQSINTSINENSITQSIIDLNSNNMFGTLNLDQSTETIRKHSLYLSNSTLYENQPSQNQFDKNPNGTSATNFKTEDMNSIHIPEKNSSEVYINPPNKSEINDECMILRLLKNEEIIPETIKNLPIPAKDKDFTLDEVEEETLQKIEQCNYINFYSSNKRLNERSKLFRKKTTKEILTFKNEYITGRSLLQLSSKEASDALHHFENLLQFITERNPRKHSLNQYASNQISYNDGYEQRIQQLLEYSKKNSNMFKNEVLTQTLKLLNNNKNEIFTQNLLNYLVVFCYCYKIEEEYATAILNFLIFDLLKQWKTSSSIQRYIKFIIPTILRSISYEEERENIYSKCVMNETKINALIFQNQIKVLITLPNITQSNVKSFLIDADSDDNFYKLKENVMKYLNINSKRFDPDLFEFFEVFQTEDDEVFERLIYPSEGVWDVIHEQGSTRNKSEYETKRLTKKQKKTYSFMFKPIFLYTIYEDDEIGISLLQSQIQFDTHISNLIFDDNIIVQMLAHLKNITQVEDLSMIIPLCYSDEQLNDKSKQVLQYFEKNVKDQFNRIQSQYQYIQLAKNNPNILGLKLQIQYCQSEDSLNCQNLLLILNSQSMSFYEQDNQQNMKSLFSYQFSQLTHWLFQENFLIIKTNDNHTHTIYTSYSHNIQYYINQSINLMKQQDEQYYESIKNIYNSNNSQKDQQMQTQFQLPSNLNSKESLLQYQNLYRNT